MSPELPAIGLNLMVVLPDLFLALVLLAMVGVAPFLTRNAYGITSVVCIGSLILTAALILLVPVGASGLAFFGMIERDGFGDFAKVTMALLAALAMLLARPYLEREGLARFEYPLLAGFSVLGMFIMVSANDLLSVYVGLELQSLALYVLASFGRSSQKSSEAGLKYFLLGALASGILLYGISLVYGFTGLIGFDALAAWLTVEEAPLGVIVGLTFIAAGMAFKLAAAPFHMWTPDVYEGAPTGATAFFAAVPKIAAIVLLARLLLEPFAPLATDWRQILWVMAVISMIIGAFAALQQNDIKRLLAYSSIGNVGYALIGLTAGTAMGLQSVLIYITIYAFTTLGAFGLVMALSRSGRGVVSVQDLAGLGKSHPGLALAMAAIMFSLTGIPPLVGFFAKYYVFMAAIETEQYALAIIGVLTSVVAAFYYLRIVKVMYFDDQSEPLDRQVPAVYRYVLTLIGGAAIFALPFIGAFVDLAERAARSLLI